MTGALDRLRSAAEILSEVLRTGEREVAVAVAELRRGLRVLQGDTADRRIQGLLANLEVLESRWRAVVAVSTEDLVPKLRMEAAALQPRLEAAGLGLVLKAVAGGKTSSVGALGEAVLQGVLAATEADRGFVLFSSPDCAEAEVVAAAAFESTQLSLEEYRFSRGVLRDALRDGRTLALTDAQQHPEYSKRLSVRDLQLRAVLAVPMKHGRHTLGALYLERRAPLAFDAADQRVAESVGEATVFLLAQAGLLPVRREGSRSFVLDEAAPAADLVGAHPSILALRRDIDQVARSHAAVMVVGETGTGKELVARAIHERSPRRGRPFVAINCAAIPDHLLESELFGHEKGAFTGATERRIGQIAEADGGTLFLDEVSELAYPLQAKLLRFLQEGRFRRVGGREEQADVRVVAASSKDLKALVASGRFQDALYYRLNVVPLRVPPLRERREDIPLLVAHFLRRFPRPEGPLELTPAALQCLREYAYPGNVRELENLMERLVVMAREPLVRAEHLPPEMAAAGTLRVHLGDGLLEMLRTPPVDMADLRRRRLRLRELLADQERALAARTVESLDGSVARAAERLGVHRVWLHRLLRRRPPAPAE